MSEEIGMCPICRAPAGSGRLFIEENIDPNKISEFSFASRKEPEYMSHRMMQCMNCDLVYAITPPTQTELAAAYHAADYDSSDEASDAATAYIHAIDPILSQLPERCSALEIGTGTGVFLELLAQRGFKQLIGVEPSVEAISAAPANRRNWIREGVFREQDFEPHSFDLICCFMTMEHVRDPIEIASSARRLLKPGGAFVTVTHDYRSWVNRLMGRRSPIIDIEHLQIFSERSIQMLFKECGYARISTAKFKNIYSLQYWLRIAPLPSIIKRSLIKLCRSLGGDTIKVGLNVGNTIAAGFSSNNSLAKEK